MNTLIQLFILSLVFNTAHAGLIEANYSFDGTNLTLESGEEIRDTEFTLGDTITLTFSASNDDSYWDFSDIDDRGFEGFDLFFTESASRQTDGHFYFYNDGTLVKSSWYYIWDEGYNAGPYSMSVNDLGIVDTFKIEYRMYDSTATSDIITTSSSNWSIWNTFGGGNDRVPFVNGQAVSVPEPTTLAMLALSIFALVGFKLRKSKK